MHLPHSDKRKVIMFFNFEQVDSKFGFLKLSVEEIDGLEVQKNVHFPNKTPSTSKLVSSYRYHFYVN